MAGRQELEQWVGREEKVAGIIDRRQSLLDGLDTGTRDVPLSLKQASNLVTANFLARRVTYLRRTHSELSAQIDCEALQLGENYLRSLAKAERQLSRVMGANIPEIGEEDKARFQKNVEDLIQLPLHDALLARGITLYKRQQEEAKQRAMQAAQETEEEQERVVTYADIEKRIRLTGVERMLMEGLLPFASEKNTVLASVWADSVWPDTPKKRLLQRLSSALLRLRKKLQEPPGTGLSIVNTKPTKAGIEASYYLNIEDRQPQREESDDHFWIVKLSPHRDYRRLSNRAMREWKSAEPETKQFVAEFLESENAYALLNPMHSFSFRERPVNRRERPHESDFFRLAAAYLAEWLEYRARRKEHLAQGLYMLSPLQKFMLYANAYLGEKEPVDSGYGLNPEIKGVSSPDILFVKPMSKDNPDHLEIVAVGEVKNVTNESEDIRKYIVEQRAKYTPNGMRFNLRLLDPSRPDMSSKLGRLIHRLIPELPALPLTVSDNLEVFYALTDGSRSLNLKDTKFFTIPISSGGAGAVVRILDGLL